MTRVTVLTMAAAAVLAGAENPAVEAFNHQVQEYMNVRKQAAAKVRPLGKNATPEAIEQHQKAFAQAIRDLRNHARPGDVFVPEIRLVLNSVLEKEFTGPEGPDNRATVKEGNPAHEKATGEVEPVIEVNATYPKNAPLSTVPPALLFRLPKLPPELEYRFVGRAMIIRDREANIIVDFIRRAVPVKHNALLSSQ